MELTSDMLSIRRSNPGRNIRNWGAEADTYSIIMYLKPEQVEHIKTRLLLSPKLNWTGKATIDITRFELTPGQSVGYIMLGVDLGNLNTVNGIASLRLTKSMLEGNERFIETEVQLKGTKQC
ncbi:MAG: hypothetical protein [Bacteriophage sp.]|nr:MAG: hypothetical protein [Bacteriophage sp.]